MPGSQSPLLRQFTRFAGVGAAATAIQYVVLGLLVAQFGLSAEVASSIGFLVSMFFNYAANRRYTFASDAAHATALPRFLATAVIGLAINYALMALLTRQAHVHYLAAQLIATIVVLAWNFSVNRIWAFRKS